MSKWILLTFLELKFLILKMLKRNIFLVFATDFWAKAICWILSTFANRFQSGELSFLSNILFIKKKKSARLWDTQIPWLYGPYKYLRGQKAVWRHWSISFVALTTYSFLGLGWDPRTNTGRQDFSEPLGAQIQCTHSSWCLTRSSTCVNLVPTVNN